MSLQDIFEPELKAALEWFDDNPIDSPHFDCAVFALRRVIDPDYEAAERVMPAFVAGPGRNAEYARRVVDAALSWVSTPQLDTSISVKPDYEAAADWLRRVGLAGVVSDSDIEGGFVAMAEEVVNRALAALPPEETP